MNDWDMNANENSFPIPDGMKLMGGDLDHAVAAFLTDLEQRGLSEKVLLVMTGEMGRTPQISPNKRGPGRDHWANPGALALAGGGPGISAQPDLHNHTHFVRHGQTEARDRRIRRTGAESGRSRTDTRFDVNVHCDSECMIARRSSTIFSNIKKRSLTMKRRTSRCLRAKPIVLSKHDPTPSDQKRYADRSRRRHLGLWFRQ
jgi:hypothetical protein